MIVYILESMVLALVTFAWLTFQSVLGVVSPIDYIVFIIEAIALVITLICVIFIKDNNIQHDINQSVFIINFSLFLLYSHIIDQCYNYTTSPSDPKDYTCTNHPPSKSYRLILMGNNPYEITCVYTAISLSFLMIQLLLSIANATPFNEKPSTWTDCTIMLIASTHCIVTYYDEVFWYTTILYIVLIAYAIHFVAWLLVLTTPSYQQYLNTLTQIRVLLQVGLLLSCYLFLVMHTNVYLQTSFLSISGIILLTVIPEYYSQSHRVVNVPYPQVSQYSPMQPILKPISSPAFFTFQKKHPHHNNQLYSKYS